MGKLTWVQFETRAVFGEIRYVLLFSDGANDIDKFVVRHVLGSVNADEMSKQCTDTSCLPQVSTHVLLYKMNTNCSVTT